MWENMKGLFSNTDLNVMVKPKVIIITLDSQIFQVGA